MAHKSESPPSLCDLERIFTDSWRNTPLFKRQPHNRIDFSRSSLATQTSCMRVNLSKNCPMVYHALQLATCGRQYLTIHGFSRKPEMLSLFETTGREDVQDDAKADKRLKIVWGSPKSTGGSAITTAVIPAAPAKNAVSADLGALRILHWRMRVVVATKPVVAPFPNIPVYVVKGERVRLIGPGDGRSFEIRSVLSLPVRVPSVKIRFAATQVGSDVKWCNCSRPAGIFPLGFGGQTVSPFGSVLTLHQRQTLAEFICRLPRHVLDRQFSCFLFATRSE